MTGLVAGILSDCLSLKGIPTGAASAALIKLINKRHAMLREIILGEIRQGNFNNVDEDDLASVFFRLIRDAEEGVARNNLRLLARMINGMAEKNDLKAPTFLRYASVLASLTETEIDLLSTMVLEQASCYEGCKHALNQKFGEDEAKAILQSLVRTGLVSFHSGLESEYKERRATEAEEHYDVGPIVKYVETDFWTNYELTSLMSEILSYTEFFFEESEAA